VLCEGAISEWFALLAKADLLPIGFHDLRHGAASMAIVAGVLGKSVAEQLGHTTAAFTRMCTPRIPMRWPSMPLIC
jgi:integrase